MSQRNKDVAAAFFVALGRGDVAGLQRVLHPELVAIATGTSLFSGTRRVQDVLDAAAMLKSAAPEGIEFTVVSMTAEENRVSAEAEGRSVLANGSPYDNQYHFLFTVQDGQIVGIKEYFCTKLADAALGPLVAGGATG